MNVKTEQLKEQCGTTFTLKDELYKLTYEEYIELCLGNTSVLIVSGTPDEETLNKVKEQLLLEFQTVAGNFDLQSNVHLSFKSMELQLELVSLQFCIKLIDADVEIDKVKDYLTSKKLFTGYKLETYQDRAKLIRWLNSRCMNISTQIKTLEKTVGDKKEKNEDKKPERADFIRLLVSVSQFLKFEIKFDVNCAVFAEYVNRMQQHVKEMMLRDSELKTKRKK